ncbi:MAG: DUF3836 domain-containing protein [Bacteroidota bacterium]
MKLESLKNKKQIILNKEQMDELKGGQAVFTTTGGGKYLPNGTKYTYTSDQKIVDGSKTTWNFYDC